MLEMFRVRDRTPRPSLVPWAGEFVGKYLISAIQALRMTDRREVEGFVGRVVNDLISTQADDGYLGPFPKADRLLGNWDLWGHYHVILALLLWHEHTGDRRPLEAALRAGDLVCRTYLGTGRRVLDAGSHEMNMAVIHAMGSLYRLSGNQSYLRLMREIEKDFERAGDYYRQGLAAVEFYRTPRPRWESLHDIQGLVELYRITGDASYRTAFVNLWRSIARRDVHNTGGFSSGEKAVGHPYSPAAIETCCTIAWTALTVDMLRLTADPIAADALELATFNAVAGAQHPSGRWWTYNTPMDGARQASAHSIVFQARTGTPELNCCSVNAPRGLGVLSEWAVMKNDEGVMINYFGPCRVTLPRGGSSLLVEQDASRTTYPKGGDVLLRISPDEPETFTLQLRIPAWSRETTVRLNGEEVSRVEPGKYLSLRRRWNKGDTIFLRFDMRLRISVGDRDAVGRISVYRGPILLAYDQRWNSFDEDGIPTLDAREIAGAAIGPVETGKHEILDPWLLITLRGSDGRDLTACDFASAGARGTRYRSWLPAVNAPPPRVLLDEPLRNQRLGPGRALFRWSGLRPRSGNTSCRLLVSASEDFSAIFLSEDARHGFLIPEKDFAPGQTYHWKITARNEYGVTESEARKFHVDPEQEPLSKQEIAALVPEADGLLLGASLRGSERPDRGLLQDARDVRAAEGIRGEANGALYFDGKKARLRFRIPYFPEETFSVTIWAKIHSFPRRRIGQIFSAWAAGMDDPLRIVVDGEQLRARIEAGQAYATDGVPIETERWTHIAAVKDGRRLSLYTDGKLVTSTTVPLTITSSARNLALGANPNYQGNEYLEVTLADFRLYARALDGKEIGKLAREPTVER